MTAPDAPKTTSESTMNIKFSRRHFLATSTGALGAIAMPYLSRAADRPAVTHGVQSGDVTVDGGVVWARADRPSQMLVEVATTESFKDARALPPIAALPESDFTAKMLIENLPGGQDIFYRVRFRDLSHGAIEGEPVVGRFRTAPADRRDVSFVWGGDVAGQGWGINPDDGGMFTFSAMRKHRPDFFLHSGDTIYADGPIESEVKLADGKTWKNVTIPEKAKVAETLDEYRAAHKYNLTDANLRAFNAEVPIFVQWDDHEVTNNWSLSKELPATYKVRDIALLAARAGRAFHEMYPMRESINEPGRVYRQISYGPHLDVFVLDERSYRGPNGANLETAYGPASYFLGPDQIAWLKRGLLNSRATWKVIASDMPLSLVVSDTPKGGSEAIAQGDGPVRGREFEIADILRFIKTAPIKQHGVADRGRALRRRALLRPEQGAIPGFRAVLGIRLRPAARRHLRSERARQHVWAGGALRQGAGQGQPEPAAVGRHAVLRSRQDRRRLRPDDGDPARPRRRRAVVDDAGSEARLSRFSQSGAS
ncbi:alkaline phosphatase D [Bradyrhizobium diazoefficiens]